MSFTVNVFLPRYKGQSLSFRARTPGTQTRANGSADDAMADTASNGQFAATVAEDLLGKYEYTIYQSTREIRTGWFRRVADQATVVLDDPQDFSAENVIATVNIPAIEADSIVIGREVTRYRGTQWSISVENLLAIPAKCYVTIKRGNEPDAKAVCQTVKSNPGAGTDGLKILNGSTSVTAANASIVYQQYTNADDETRHRAVFTLEAASAAAIIADTYRLDFKDTATDKILGECVLRVVNPVTLATS